MKTWKSKLAAFLLGTVFSLPIYAQQVPNPVGGPNSALTGNVPVFKDSSGRQIIDGGYKSKAFRSKNFFVSPTGLDTANCLSSVVGGGNGPCLTITRALAVAMNSDSMPPTGPTLTPPTLTPADHLIINLAAGTYTETVTINGNPPMLSPQRWDWQYSSPMIVLKGAGSGSTEIVGPATVLGYSYCYTVLAINGAYVGLEGLSVRSDDAGSPCQKTNLYVQLATMYVLADVKLKSATGNMIMLEESANFYVTPGYQSTPGLTLMGNAGWYGIVSAANSMFVSDSAIRIEGGPWNIPLLFYADEHSSIKLSLANPAVTCWNVGQTVEQTCLNKVNGRRFGIYGNSFMIVGNAPSPWPGSIGLVEGGSRYRASDSFACVGSAANCPQNTTPWSGLGTGGTVGISTGSSAYGGYVELIAGTGAEAAGSVYIGFPYELSRGVCAPVRSNGDGTWNVGVRLATNGFTTPSGVAIGWDNNGVALTPGLNYFLGWVCNTTN